MKVNWANRVTIGRLILAIIFLVLLSQYRAESAGRLGWLLDVCLAIFIVAALTDILDGYLARKFNQVTTFGRVSDPFVDKLLVCGAFIFFATADFAAGNPRVSSFVAPWMVVVIVGRELLVSGIRGFSESQGRMFAANVFGKVKMFVQCVTIGFVLGCRVHGESVWGWFVPLRHLLVWLTVAITALSVLGYAVRAAGVLRTQPEGKGNSPQR
jgi:CDP-diacylglycerol--glycerol-3-phosphate 3-phosphatidyltransferase